MPHYWLHGGVLQNPGLQRLVSWAQAAWDDAVGPCRRRLLCCLLMNNPALIKPSYLVQPAQLHKGAHAKRHLYLRAARRRQQQRRHT